MTIAHVNRIATNVPPHEVHGAFVTFAKSLLEGERERTIFARLTEKARIRRRYSVIQAPTVTDGRQIDTHGFYTLGSFPTTGERMKVFERHAPDLAESTVVKLDLGYAERARITHVVVTSCTGSMRRGSTSSS